MELKYSYTEEFFNAIIGILENKGKLRSNELTQRMAEYVTTDLNFIKES